MLSLVPNEYWEYSFADMIRGVFTAFWRGDSKHQLHIALPGLGECLTVRSARAAIVVALKSLDLPPGASIAAPLYCCPVVLRAIESAGCKPRFIDVDRDTCCLSAKDLAAKNSEVDAVLAVHMFGNLCDMASLRKAAPGKPIIEDCAQALGSRLGDRPAGSFGDIAVFSFRSGKYISVGEGGAILCRDKEVEARAAKHLQEMPPPSCFAEGVHVLKTYLRSLLRREPFWGLVGSRLWNAYSEKVSFESQALVVPGQIYETDRTPAVRRIAVLGSRVEKQRSHADYYSRNLTLDPGMLCSETQGAYFNRLQFPVLVPGGAKQLVDELKMHQISTSRPYKDIPEIAKHYGYQGDCPESERIARSVLVIPCHHALSIAEVERITISVNQAWKDVSAQHRDLELESQRNSAIEPQTTH